MSFEVVIEVDGQRRPALVNLDTPIHTLIDRALLDAGFLPAGQWVLRDISGCIFDASRRVRTYAIEPGETLYLERL